MDWAEFKKSRELMIKQLTTLNVWVIILKQLYIRQSDRIDEMNYAPAFFQHIMSALYTAIIVSANNLLSEKKNEVSVFNFLELVEQNKSKFQGNIAKTDIKEHRRYLKNLPFWSALKMRRNKDIAHIDKKYAFDPDLLEKHAPLNFGCIEELIRAATQVINEYSLKYDEKCISSDVINGDDINTLLDILHFYRQQSMEI